MPRQLWLTQCVYSSHFYNWSGWLGLTLRVCASPHLYHRGGWLRSGNMLLSMASDSGEGCKTAIDGAVTSERTRGNERPRIPLLSSDRIPNGSDNNY